MSAYLVIAWKPGAPAREARSVANGRYSDEVGVGVVLRFRPRPPRLPRRRRFFGAAAGPFSVAASAVAGSSRPRSGSGKWIVAGASAPLPEAVGALSGCAAAPAGLGLRPR